MTDTARLFVAGRCQAVRLPRTYRIDGNEVFIREDPATGDVVLSRKPENWQGFLEHAARMQAPNDFLEVGMISRRLSGIHFDGVLAPYQRAGALSAAKVT